MLTVSPYNYGMETDRGIKALGNLLRAARKEKMWAQKDVSDRTGLTIGYISNVERGYVNPKRGPVIPSDDSLRSFSSALDIPLSRLHDALGRFGQDAQRTAVRDQPTLYVSRDPRLNDAMATIISALDRDADHLARIGPDVNISALSSVPLSPLRASAGTPILLADSGREYQTLQDEIPTGTRAIQVQGDCMAPYYASGDIVFVRENPEAENGQKVVALVDGEHLSCKVFRANGERYLEPVNGAGKIAADRFRIVGVVIGYFRREG